MGTVIDGGEVMDVPIVIATVFTAVILFVAWRDHKRPVPMRVRGQSEKVQDKWLTYGE